MGKALLKDLMPEIKALAISNAGEKAQPELSKIGIDWKADVAPMVENLDSVAALTEFVTELCKGPEAFLISKNAALKEKIEAFKKEAPKTKGKADPVGSGVLTA